MISEDAQNMGPAIARKVGEGFGRPDADIDLPLDIVYSKLIDWLVSRQRLPQDWRKHLQAAQGAAAEAHRTLEPAVSSQLPLHTGTSSVGLDALQLDYFRAREVRDLLAKGAEKNLFGYYTGEAGVWDKVVRAYESKDVWLGEAAMMMTRNTDYEIPYFRKAAAKAGQQLKDLERRGAEYLRSAATASAEYQRECGQLGIAGGDVRRELVVLTQQLPGLLEAAVEHLRSPALGDAFQQYAAFTQHAHPQALDGDGDGTLSGLLHTLAGARAGRGPAECRGAGVAAPGLAGGQEVCQAVIDWGVDTPQAQDAGSADGGLGTLGGPVEISWDVDVSGEEHDAGGGGGAGICWDIEPGPPGVEAAPESPREDLDARTTAGLDIDWDISAETCEDSAGGLISASADDDALGQQAELGRTESVVTGLCTNSDFRNRLLDDVYELRAFLLQREAEAGGASPAMLAGVGAAPEAVQQWTAPGAAAAALAELDAVIAELTGRRVAQLLMLQDSEASTAHLVAALQRQAGKEPKFRRGEWAAEEVEAKQRDILRALASEAPKLAFFQQRTSLVKSEVEAALSKAFNGRQVNIIGEVNNVLS